MLASLSGKRKLEHELPRHIHSHSLCPSVRDVPDYRSHNLRNVPTASLAAKQHNHGGQGVGKDSGGEISSPMKNRLIALIVMLATCVYGTNRPVAWNEDLSQLQTVQGGSTNGSYGSKTNAIQLTARNPFHEQAVVIAGSTNDGTADALNPNGIYIGGTNAVDKWIIWGDEGTNWAIGTYRSENQGYWYLYNALSQLPVLSVSQTGRGGWNHPDNIVDYHSLWSGSGLDDLDFGGINTAKQVYRYQVSIVTTGACDTWTWKASADNGATYYVYGLTNDCALTNMSLANGVTVVFGATNGHAIGETWDKIGWSQLPVASWEVRPRRFRECLLGVDWHSATDTYTDVSYDFGTGLREHDILADTNACLLLGAKTPINTFFWNVLSPSIGLTLVAEFWNGSAWVELTQATHSFFDKTVNLTQYGEMQYEISSTTQATMCPAGRDATSYTLYWYRFRTSATPTSGATVRQVTPHGEKRLAVYSGMLNPTPSLWVNGRGHVYGDRIFRQDVSAAYGTNELITESRANFLIGKAAGIPFYPSTNIVSGNVMASYTTPQAFSWATTNAVTANSTNRGSLSVYTNATLSDASVLGTNMIAAGRRFTLERDEAAYGIAGFSSVARMELVEWNTAGLTNVIATSADSAVIPNQSSPLSHIVMTFTASTNMTFASSTNYLAWRSALVTSGNKAGTWLKYYGASYPDSKFTVGGTSGGGGGTTINNTYSYGFTNQFIGGLSATNTGFILAGGSNAAIRSAGGTNYVDAAISLVRKDGMARGNFDYTNITDIITDASFRQLDLSLLTNATGTAVVPVGSKWVGVYASARHATVGKIVVLYQYGNGTNAVMVLRSQVSAVSTDASALIPIGEDRSIWYYADTSFTIIQLKITGAFY